MYHKINHQKCSIRDPKSPSLSKEGIAQNTIVSANHAYLKQNPVTMIFSKKNLNNLGAKILLKYCEKHTKKFCF